MNVFAGLGNPGAKYAGHRHNIGFMALDAIAEAHGFGPWKAKFQGQCSEGRLGGQKVLLLKPETFMNLSGQSVAEAMRFYRLEPAALTVFHDELDLAPGKVKVKSGGGHAGHNGLRSLQAHLGPEFRRVRMGIGHPGHKDRVSGYVLHDFSRADRGWLEPLLEGIAAGAPELARGDAGRFLTAVALRTSPPRSGTGERAPQGKPAAKSPAIPAACAEPPAEAPVPRPGPEPDRAEESGRSALQRLVDRFR